MDKRISDLIGENAGKNAEIAELKKSLQFILISGKKISKPWITWRANYYKTKNINNNKNNQLYQT